MCCNCVVEWYNGSKLNKTTENDMTTYQQLQTELDRAWEILMSGNINQAHATHLQAVIRDLESKQEALPIDQQH